MTPITFRKAGRMALGRDQLLNIVEMSYEPFVLVASLWAVVLALGVELAPRHVILAVVVFSLTFPGAARLSQTPWRVVRNILMGWIALAGLLLLFGYASHYLAYFGSDVLVAWSWAAPLSLVGGHFVLRAAAPVLRDLEGGPRRAVVAGMNDQGVELARRLGADLYSNVQVAGFFDDRTQERASRSDDFSMLGKLSDLAEYVKRNHVELIYLSLPMASQQRILALLDELRDTTASIYFVPDIFVTDLIQGRMDSVRGMPIVGVCDSPFSGVDGLTKRGSDIVLSLLILVMISPLLLLLALAVKLSSRGPAIFKQRRYGLDGDEIIVYKFRTMTVQEDGASIVQAGQDDARITPFGALMRKSSLDELPQFFNVLQGRMSIVGPRPHAVAHNEMYRKLIKSYMRRHKVRPGITGWAQVNGLRGETKTLDKMKARVEYDLDYLRNWSLRLDLFIIVKTVWVVGTGVNAY